MIAIECAKHPLYKGVRPPKTCVDCWSIYYLKLEMHDLMAKGAKLVLRTFGRRYRQQLLAAGDQQ